MTAPRIHIVSKGRRNAQLMLDLLAKNGAEAMAFQKLEDLEAALPADAAPDLVFIDVAGFGREIWSTCEKLHAREVPFFIIYPPSQERLEALSSTHGARGSLKKPISVAVLSKLVQDISRGDHV